MNYTVIDFETTGLDYLTEQIIEIGAIKYNSDFKEVGRLHTMVKLTEGKKLSAFITKLTGIKEEDTRSGVTEVVGLNMLKDFIADSIVIAQHAPFDLSFLAKAVEPEMFIDTRSLSHLLNPNEKAGLKDLCSRYGVKLEGHHRSINDCEATAGVFMAMVEEAKAQGIAYTNVVVKSSSRKLNFIPLSGIVIDINDWIEHLKDKEKGNQELEEV